jgi:hypothetical protein
VAEATKKVRMSVRRPTSMRRMLDENSRDFVYYRDHGWFESDYYYPTHLGPFKKVAGTAFDWAGARVSRQLEG